MKQKALTVTMLLAMLLVCACSTNKNTALTRRVQAFKALYNTYYNGHLAFIDGREAQQEGNKDNFTEVIPVYMQGNKNTIGLGKANYDRTVEKMQKTIKQHSITVRPQWNSNKPKTAKDRLWLSQKEYNPFLYKAWFMMGEAQFRKGEFMEAASTFAYIQRLYFSKPNLVARARLLEAKCYAELEWFYEAENLVNATRRDSFPTNLEPLRASVLADCQVRQKLYEDAIPNVKTALKKCDGSLQKARLHFLLGQLYRETGQTQLAFKEFRKVYRSNPPYDLDFNARIQQTEVMSKGQSKKMIRKLQAMARNQKNKDYLDQVYYAIGNIYLSQGDTTRAIWAYKDGVEKSTRNGLEKGVVWLHLGQLYWEKEEFVKAHECYAGALGLFDKDRDDYKDIDERTKILEELLPYATAVETQDSLQAMARMDSVALMKKIQQIIAEVKKKEKEKERKKLDAATPGANASAAANGANQGRTGAGQNRAGGQGGGLWYFYNPTAVAAGKREFQQKWGQRQLEDNWRRKNKTVLDDFSNNEDSEGVAEGDSIQKPADDSIEQPADSLSDKEKKELEKQKEYEQDPHRPEYYLKDIPFTEEQMAASNAALVDGLYNSAIIYKDRMENFPLAERTFLRVLLNFPDFEHFDEVYYNLFQLYSRTGRFTDAADYKNRLVSEYPENEHAKLVADPNFEFKGRYGKHLEDSLYQQAYDAFQLNDYRTVINNSEFTEREYPQGDNRARFMFLTALSRLELGERDQFLGAMRDIVEKFPKSTVSELAGLYVKGLKEGRLLASGKYEMGSIWERRLGVGEELDSAAIDTTFSAERNTNFVFVIAYERDSISENQLLYEMAHYNFTSFTIRNFDLIIDRGDGIDMLQVRTFNNYDEAYIYLHRLMNDEDMAYKLEGLRPFIISEDNLKKLMKGRSFADYFAFYDKNFDRVGSLRVDDNALDEPEIPTEEELELMEEEEEEEELEEVDNFIF